MKSRKETRFLAIFFSKLLASKPDYEQTQVVTGDIGIDKQAITYRTQKQNPTQHFQTTIPFFQACFSSFADPPPPSIITD